MTRLRNRLARIEARTSSKNEDIVARLLAARSNPPPPPKHTRPELEALAKERTPRGRLARALLRVGHINGG